LWVNKANDVTRTTRPPPLPLLDAPTRGLDTPPTELVGYLVPITGVLITFSLTRETDDRDDHDDA
jgi:hypothetical protein